MSAAWVRHARRCLLLAGLPLLLASALVGAAGIPTPFFLVAVGGFAVVTAMMTGVAALFGITHGVVTMLARSYFKTGWLEANGATGCRRSSVILTGGVFALSALAAFSLHLDSEGGGELLAYTFFLFLPAFLSFVATIITLTVLRSDLRGVR
ncbi:hypothetical protein OOZ19_23885 [Saccharopolyspora sp. NFXS83]|uniref:hypothetical protein n=1 Tax=Saccharopolyspora sp. NFXS83 TaxID=2993560 RepID=UPI00224AD374|nr:hypothetical protein [Saccharopolyspora sp. NFXS83]MCX2733295.1 hypothetical protein [Saccharopolyspora sp. NFXS83]